MLSPQNYKKHPYFFKNKLQSKTNNSLKQIDDLSRILQKSNQNIVLKEKSLSLDLFLKAKKASKPSLKTKKTL